MTRVPEGLKEARKEAIDRAIQSSSPNHPMIQEAAADLAKREAALAASDAFASGIGVNS